MTSKSGPLPAYLGRYLELNIDNPARPDTNPNNIVLHIIVFGVTASNYASGSHLGHLQFPPPHHPGILNIRRPNIQPSGTSF